MNEPKATLATAPDSLVKLLDPAACRAWLIEQLHPRGLACPRCGTPPQTERQRERLAAFKPIPCAHCGRAYSATSGTVLSKSRLQPEQLVYLLHLLAQGLPDKTIAQRLGIHRSNVCRWRATLGDLCTDHNASELPA